VEHSTRKGVICLVVFWRRRMELSNSVFSFAYAVCSHWAALMTGGLIMAALAVWERHRHQISPKLYSMIAICAVFVAFLSSLV
jgi:uncharacterized membrane protein